MSDFSAMLNYENGTWVLSVYDDTEVERHPETSLDEDQLGEFRFGPAERPPAPALREAMLRCMGFTCGPLSADVWRWRDYSVDDLELTAFADVHVLVDVAAAAVTG